MGIDLAASAGAVNGLVPDAVAGAVSEAVSDIRSRIGAALFAKVAGPEGNRTSARIHGRPGERWFEPGSPIQRVHGDASMFVGGLRALMLQALHPAAMTAVAEHSGFRGDMWGRLARTSTFVAVTTYGTAEDAQAAVDAVRRIHDRITGTMADGTPYRASDPHLLGWIHVAELDSFLAAFDAYGAEPLTPAERDEYVAQSGFVAEKLGVVDPPRTEPSSGSRSRRTGRSCVAASTPGTPSGSSSATRTCQSPHVRRTWCSSPPPSASCRCGPDGSCCCRGCR